MKPLYPRCCRFSILMSMLVLIAYLMVGCSSDEEDTSIGGDVGADVGSDADVSIEDVGDEDAYDEDAGPENDVVDFEELEPHERYFEALRRARALFQESGDNLPATAERLVADEEATDEEKARALFEFVRDEIAAVPNDGPSYYEDLLTRERWGSRATLYSGIGTPREKAEVLVMLYERAGFDAEVVGPWELDESQYKVASEVFGHPVENISSVELPDNYEEWSSAFRPAPEIIEESENFEVDDLHGEEFSLENRLQYAEDASADQQARTDALVDELRGLLPEDFGDNESEVIEELALPLVELHLDDSPRIVNPLHPDAAFSDDFSNATLEAAPEAQGMLSVDVSVEYATAAQPDVWVPAVEGQWKADELAGRRLYLNFLNHLAFEQRASKTLREVESFSPMLAIGADDLSEEEQWELSAMGDPFSLSGEPIEYVDGDFQIGNHTLKAESESVSSSDVEDVELTLDVRNFPCVNAALEVRDDQNEAVEGLPAAAFEVEESGEQLGATMLSNQASPPRILFIIDISGSVPEEFRSEETVEFLVELAEEAADEHPNAEFSIVQHSLIPKPDEDIWTQSMEELEQQGLETINSSYVRSPLWGALAEGNGLDPTVIVFVNDAQANDEFTSEKEEKIRQGAPVIVVGVGPVDEDKAETMVELSGGELVEAQEVDEITPPLLSFLDEHVNQHYLFRFLAPLEGPDTRELTVTVPDTGAEVTEHYDVPEEVDLTRCPMPVAGLRTTVRIGDREVTRHLAGGAEPEDLDYETRDFEDDVLTLLGGVVTYSFDGAKPVLGTFGERLTDSLLTAETYIGDLHSGDPFAAFDEASASPLNSLPQVANPPIASRSDESTRTYPTGLRSSLTIERIDPDGHGELLEFDILPLAGLETLVTPGAGEAFGRAHWPFDDHLDDRWGNHDLLEDGTSPTFVEGPKGLGALEMDGDEWYFAEDLVIDAETGELEDMAVCAWVQLPEGSDGGTIIAAGREAYFRLWADGSGDVGLAIADHINRNRTATAEDILETDRWHHICGMYNADATTSYVYVDGEREDSHFNAIWNYYGVGSGDERIVTVGSHATTTTAGERGHDDDSDNFVGRMADVRYFDHMLTPAQIGELATGFDATHLLATGAQHTLERTAGVAVAEASSFGSDEVNELGEPRSANTLDLLEGRELAMLPPSSNHDFGEAFPDLSEDEREHWQRVTDIYGDDWYLVVPEDGQPVAFYAIHETTGELIAILPDGKGGGLTSIQRGCVREKLMEAYLIDYQTATFNSPAKLGVWIDFIIAYSAWRYQMFNMATTSLGWVTEFEPGDEIPEWLDDLQERALKTFACTFAMGILGATLSDLYGADGELVVLANDILGLFGLPNIGVCPTNFELCDDAEFF